MNRPIMDGNFAFSFWTPISLSFTSSSKLFSTLICFMHESHLLIILAQTSFKNTYTEILINNYYILKANFIGNSFSMSRLCFHFVLFCLFFNQFMNPWININYCQNGEDWISILFLFFVFMEVRTEKLVYMIKQMGKDILLGQCHSAL